MYLENIRKLEIMSGKIERSRAKFKGGAIYFSCEDSTKDCNLILGKQFTVTGNRALEGGGIFSEDVHPTFEGAKIEKNIAVLYGNDKASFPVRLVKFVPVSSTIKKDNLQENSTDVKYFERYFNTEVPEDWTLLDPSEVKPTWGPVIVDEENDKLL